MQSRDRLARQVACPDARDPANTTDQDRTIRTGAPPNARKRIYVVDRDRAASEALAKTLASLGYEVRVAPSAAALAGATLPDGNSCVLIDISFGDQSGFDLQQHFLDRDTDAGIVFMTAHADISMAVAAMKRGAVDFLAKPLRMSELLPAVDEALWRCARRREAKRRHALFSERVARLTPREREVLALVLEGKRNKQIADALASQESTVKVHRSRLMRKLEVRTLADLLRIDAELGRERASASTHARRHDAAGHAGSHARDKTDASALSPRFGAGLAAMTHSPAGTSVPEPIPHARNRRR